MFFQIDLQPLGQFGWLQAGQIALFYLLAWLIHLLAPPLSRRLLATRAMERRGRPERMTTLQGLISGAITFFAFTLATLFSLSLFVDTSTLIWMVGLFSAAFGLGARPLVSDFLAGLSFLFEDTFDVGEKIQLPGLPGGTVEGVIEIVNLRATLVRSNTGELYNVPNGEIRVVRNFSRGRFSMTKVKLTFNTSDLNQALELLEGMARDAVAELPNLLEPWQVISETGEMGERTDLTLVAKARFGHAAEMRPRLLTLVQEQLQEAGIELVG